MPGKSLSTVEKAKILAWRQVGVSVKECMRLSGRTRRTIQRLSALAAALPENVLPTRSPGSGRPRMVTPNVIKAIKRSITTLPMLSARDLKAKHPRLLGKISVRTIRRALIRDLGLKAYMPARKPMLTAQMIAKRLEFCQTYGHWTGDDWVKVMFSDESTMRLVRGCSGWIRVRRKAQSIATNRSTVFPLSRNRGQ